MRHWHRCERWMQQRMVCPLRGQGGHEDGPDYGEPPDEDAPIPPGAPVVVLAGKRRKVEVFQEAIEEAEAAPDDVPNVTGLPVPEFDPPGAVPARVPRQPAPRPGVAPSPVPVRSGVPARAAVPAPRQVPARAAVKALRDARNMVPTGWRVSPEDVRQWYPAVRNAPELTRSHEFNQMAGNVRMALAETVVAETFGEARERQYPSRKRIAGAAVIWYHNGQGAR